MNRSLGAASTACVKRDLTLPQNVEEESNGPVGDDGRYGYNENELAKLLPEDSAAEFVVGHFCGLTFELSGPRRHAAIGPE